MAGEDESFRTVGVLFGGREFVCQEVLFVVARMVNLMAGVIMVTENEVRGLRIQEGSVINSLL